MTSTVILEEWFFHAVVVQSIKSSMFVTKFFFEACLVMKLCQWVVMFTLMGIRINTISVVYLR